ncbi:hypothetical protein KM043_011701 [Ampulex compressa]|nr:hypothetical protein KM043_011701 [Ampulex compressa]
MWNRKVFIRIVEVLLCVACVVALRVTDDESRRVFHYLRSRSREWSLLNNVTWGAIGAALASVTCGGYVIITAGLLLAAATDELKGRKTEIFFLGLGIILFAIVGALSLASIESVPPNLIDNAAVLGALCLLTALVFIADLLLSPRKKKSKQSNAQDLTDKESGIAALTTEKESKEAKTNGSSQVPEAKDVNGNINEGFDMVDSRQRRDDQESMDDRPRSDQDRPASVSNQRPKDAYHEERNRKFDHVERELREYTQNFENGRTLRESQRYREPESLQRHMIAREPLDIERRPEESRVVYKAQDIYQRPVDEIDTPRFPTEFETRSGTMFTKIVNPSVKIMRVERDVEEEFDAYRYSDTSQYDNVPVRMRGASPGILKRNRDVTFKVPPPPRINGQERSKDDIEMLEECFGVLRTTTTGTQTGFRSPSSPTDPGYVRHTASNWPRDAKTKTPGSSPERRDD